MSEEITLQALINKVKTDLLTSHKDPRSLLFFVERVELELAVSVTHEEGAGVKISLLDFFGGDVSGKEGGTKGQKMKVTLTPILTIEEQRKQLEKHPRLKKYVQQATIDALWKSVDQKVGERE